MSQAYLTYEAVLRILQIEEDELDTLIVEGTLHAIPEDEGMRFLSAEVEAAKEDREGMKTIVLQKPTNIPDWMTRAKSSDTVNGALPPQGGPPPS